MLRENDAEADSLRKQIRSFKRKTTQMSKRLESQRVLLETVDAAKTCISWMLEHAARDDESVLRPEVVLVGSGPISYNEMHEFLESRGIDVWAPDSEGVPFLIVGQKDWSQEELEMQIAAQQGDTLKVYSQQMTLCALAAGADPFETADAAMLQAFADNHAALEFLQSSELRWPLTVAPAIPNEFTPFGSEELGVDESPLKKMGYTVGKTRGLSAPARRKVLATAYAANIPFTHSEEYMEDWGYPRTRRRLWRTSHHLAWLARAWNRMPSHRYAVKDWTDDLAWLQKRYYRPWMRFAWPQVRVPG
jgi:hemerythrin